MEQIISNNIDKKSNFVNRKKHQIIKKTKLSEPN